jgi:hypothetical protein
MKRELFDEVIGTPPPSTVDVQRVMARQRRLSVVRHGGAALAGIAALAMILSVAVTLNHPKEQATGPVSAAPPEETAEQKAVRVQHAWSLAVAKVLPNAQWRAGHDGSRETPSRGDYYDATPGPVPPSLLTQTNVGHDGSEVAWHISDSFYRTFGTVKVNGIESKFEISTAVRARRPGIYGSCSVTSAGIFACSNDDKCSLGQTCRQQVGPHGEAIVIRREQTHLAEFDLPVVDLAVEVRSADGTQSVEFFIENRTGTDRGPAPESTDLALTDTQIVDILLEPGLMI